MSDLALTFDLLLQFRLHFSRKGFVCTFHAGGHSISLGLCPTKLPVKWDIQLGQLDVPALVSNFRQWRPAKPSTGMSNFPFEDPLLHCCRNLELFGLFGYLQLVQLHQNLPQSKDVENSSY